MSKENQNKKYDGQNRCRRCDRPLKDPTANYGWWCAELVGQGGHNTLPTLDETATNAYNAYVEKRFRKGRSNEGSFTTKGKNYKNSFVKEETDGNKYKVISDISALGEKFQIEYVIADGAVIFNFEDNDDYEEILWHQGGKTVAKAIYDAAKELSPDHFFGRTVDGVNAELQIHWAMYKAGILKEKASPANIGGIKAPGPDRNAWIFEGIQLTEDIVTPTAFDVVETIKEIWRYYK